MVTISAGGGGVAAVVVAVGGGGVCVINVADDGADVVFTVGGRAADGGVDHVAVLDAVAAARAAPADEGAKVHAKVNGRRGFGGGAEEDDVPDGGAYDHAEEADAAVVYADGEAADGVAAAVVGAGEAIAAGQFAYGLEVAAAGEVDVGGLSEGLAAAAVTCVDGCSQVAQVISSGDGIGGGASFGGHAEVLVAELGAALRGEAAPVARGVRLLSRDAWEDDVQQGVVVLEDITGEANGAVMLDVDALEAHTVLEGVGSDAGDAGGQGDAGHGVAVVEGILADSGNTVADGDGGEALTTDEGEVADAGHAVTDGDAGQVIAPRGIGVPNVGVVVAVVFHSSAAADGQHGVVAAVVLREAPCEAVAAGAADGLQGGADGNVAAGEGNGGTLLVGSHLAAGSSRSGEGDDGLVGIVDGQRSRRARSKVVLGVVRQRGVGRSHSNAAGGASDHVEGCGRVFDYRIIVGRDVAAIVVVIVARGRHIIRILPNEAIRRGILGIRVCLMGADGDIGETAVHRAERTSLAYETGCVAVALNGAADLTVAHVEACDIARNAGSLTVALPSAAHVDVAVHDIDVLQFGGYLGTMIIITRYKTEESGILVVAADGEATDGVVATIVVALEGVSAGGADGRPGAGERDGVGLLEINF